MKFLFDQSADFRLIPHLRQLGYDVHVISRDYPPGLPDEDVLEIARKERRVLIVADRDFGELIFQQGLAHAGSLAAHKMSHPRFRGPEGRPPDRSCRLRDRPSALQDLFCRVRKP
jgi:uncharacterized protein DUF5615